ncbi:hypothetical protein GCM10028786_29560 [Flaviaesturariibacter terrae]
MLAACSSAAFANSVTSRATGNWSVKATWLRTVTGTITTTSGSTSVTGTGFSALSVNDVLMRADGTVIGTVASIQSNTALTLTAGAANANSAAAFAHQSLPQSGDDVTINGALTVTLDMDATVNSLTVASPAGNNTVTTFTISGTSKLTVTNDLSINGGAGHRESALTFSGAGSLIVGRNLTIGNGGASATATLNMGAALASTLKVGGTLSFNTADAVFTSGTSSTVVYTGTGQTIDLTNLKFANLEVNGTSATLGAAATATNVTGTFAVTAGTLTTNNLAITRPASKSITVAAAATLDAGTSVISFGTGGSATISGTLKTANANGLAGSATTTFASTNSPSLSFTGSTVDYNSASDQAVTSSVTYSNLRLSGGGTKNVASALTVNGALTVASGATLDAKTSVISFGSGGSATISGTLKTANTNGLSGAANTTFSNGNSPTLSFSAGTVEYNSASAQNVTTGLTYGDLRISGAGTKTVGAGTLTVNGAWTIDGPTTLATNNPVVSVGNGIGGSGSLTKGTSTVTLTGGTWTNTGTFPAGINMTFSAAGSVAIPAQSFGTLTISGSKSIGGNVSATTVALSGSARVSLGGNTLTVGSVSGGGSANYFVTDGSGALKVTSTASSTFPVGPSSSLYTPVTISGTSTDWSVRVQNSFSGYPSTGTAGALPAVWHVTPGAAATASVTFQYDESQFGYSSPSTMDIYHYGVPVPNPNNYGAGWYMAAQNVSVGGTAGGVRTVSLSGQSQFSPFAASSAASPLPIRLLSFSGRKQGNATVLSWITGSESANAGFELQRSVDGVRFTTVAFVHSKAPGGNSSGQLSYSFTDNGSSSMRLYYRLNQVDLDGRGRLSNTISVGKDNVLVLSLAGLSPNPVRGGTKLSVEATDAGTLSLRIISASGAVVRSWSATVGAGNNSIDLDAAALPAGSYLLQASDGTTTASMRFVKQ